ncbi:MAG: bifunctional diguanylate cyclase/phosphodiesterase [Methylocystis sp.]|nr:MAG: bifunctional diguanylate cyclase/phosphodiesterase [Methylocystis sp.]
MLLIKALQHDVLEGLARDQPVALLMSWICERAESLAPDVVCSILSIDPAGRLRPLVAPSLPEEFSLALDGLAIGPTVGSCGTAAFLGEPVEVTDIATDPLWSDFKMLALPLGLRACWSTPIHASDGRVVGTFAFYYRSCRGPSELDRTIVQGCVNLCAIALDQRDRKDRIQRLAYYDVLTGVANRASFERFTREAIATAMKENACLAIHWIDLDNFKNINDTLGHNAGDALLKTVTQRISATLKPGEFLARVGGDEFAVVQPSAGSHGEIQDLACVLAAAVSQPVDIDGTVAAVSASIGIARAPQDGSDLALLMKKADLALYETKSHGRRNFSFYNKGIEERIASQWTLEQALKTALARKEFELHFQPVVDLATVAITGFEALLRWRRPGHGLLTPYAFLPAAEKDELLICDIGDWVLREACTCAASLPGELRIAVNLSPNQLRKPGFALDVVSALAASGLSPQRLELEITESALLLENAVTLNCLSDIRQLGVSIALDDFGTGFSALSHLRAFPVDRIKIDRSFVMEVDESHATASIIRAIIGLARELGVKTTAEGVETETQLRVLADFGCDEIQGFYVSRPKPLSAFDDYLRRGDSRRRLSAAS